MKIAIKDVDIVYLSYDEPNAEKNYADLLTKIPWAKRVHGVEGSDAAHKACAEISDTRNFVTVDGDNIISDKFLNVVVDTDKLGVTKDHQFSWCGKVFVNGLMYGNGGLKMWTKDFVQNMRTHENTDGSDDTQIEFCYFDNYYQFNQNYSISYTNETPQQAWRAGFREGVKMSLDRGSKVDDLKNIWWQNYHRLLIWCNVGADVENGLWSVLGAREGCYKTMCTDWDHTQTRDFNYLTELFEKQYGDPIFEPEFSVKHFGSELYHSLGLPISTTALSVTDSEFFKTVFVNTDRIINR